MWPESVEVFDEFPRTPSLKVVKREVVKQIVNRAGEPATGSMASKRDEILAAADRFGRDGYEDTKWADIAADVGVGPTALYHYFESKQHCLYVIMDQAIEGPLALRGADGRERRPARAADRGHRRLLPALRARHPAQSRAGGRAGPASARSDSPREEQARQDARARTRDLEFAWASFLSHAMQQGAIPKNDPRLLTRAVLGLYNSIWHWYRPNGIVALNRSPSSSPTAASP